MRSPWLSLDAILDPNGGTGLKLPSPHESESQTLRTVIDVTKRKIDASFGEKARFKARLNQQAEAKHR